VQVAVLVDPAAAAVVWVAALVAHPVVQVARRVVRPLVRVAAAVVAVVARAPKVPSDGTVRRVVVVASRGSSVVKSSTRWRRQRLVA